jgi:lactoylglutathione lyase
VTEDLPHTAFLTTSGSHADTYQRRDHHGHRPRRAAAVTGVAERSPPARELLTPGVILDRMSARYVHTCIRVLDIERSLAFYSHLGFEHRGRLNFESAYNVYIGLPGDGDVLELTVNVGRDEPYDLGDGYNHMALVVDDLDRLLDRLAQNGIEPEKPPYSPGGREEVGRICFVDDPDGYRIELIDREFPTPQDPPHPSTA